MSDVTMPAVGDTVYCVREGKDGNPVGVAKMTVRELSRFGATFRADDGDPDDPSLLTNGYRLSSWASFAAGHPERAYSTREEAWDVVRKAVTK